MNRADRENWLRLPPRRATLGGAVSVAGFEEADPLAPAHPAPPDELVAGSEVHLKATLKTGRLHLKSRSRSWARRVSVLLDDSASVRRVLGQDGAAELSGLLAEWRRRHHLDGATFTARGTDGTCRLWGIGLWEAWLAELPNWQGGLVLVVSDFHGELPAGPFWMNLFARAEPLILRLIHPRPTYQDGWPCSDDEEPAATFPWRREVFENSAASWDRLLQEFLRRSNVPHLALAAPDATVALRGCMALLTGTTTPGPAVSSAKT